MKYLVTSLVFLLFTNLYIFGQLIPVVPTVFSNIVVDKKGNVQLKLNGKLITAKKSQPKYLPEFYMRIPEGTQNGLLLDLGMPHLDGEIYYGLIHSEESLYPQPVYLKKSAILKNGRAELEIRKNLGGNHDIVGWEKTGKGTLGYRIADKSGMLIYEGVASFTYNGKFAYAISLIEGPFVNNLTNESCVISYKTNPASITTLEVNGKLYTDLKETVNHEFQVKGLDAAKKYSYKINYGTEQQTNFFKTSPLPGSKTKFSFAYVSDSRAGFGNSEANFYGPNFYIVKKIMALAAANQVAFMQFSGDLISGYVENKSDMLLQMANWKRVVGYFAKYFPVYTTIGNHECILYKFADTTRRKEYWIPRFPFDSISIEKIFADEFVNPENGPFSEDGNQYDPDKTKTDFPTYKENVYHYEYGNTAVVTLNTEYWYTEAMSDTSLTSGNIHAYVMDNQLFWLENTIAMLEKNTSIEHIFVTLHSPLFPNGGHVADDMWYGGNNKFRAYVAGKPVEKGIIERRDQILNILVNKSSKVVAILTGDEHNYCKLELGPETIIYPENYSLPKIKLSRTIYQVNNGAAGAPYYAQEKTPWTNYVTGFTSRNALVLFDVEGGKISMRVINPDTLEPIDELVLRK